MLFDEFFRRFRQEIREAIVLFQKWHGSDRRRRKNTVNNIKYFPLTCTPADSWTSCSQWRAAWCACPGRQSRWSAGSFSGSEPSSSRSHQLSASPQTNWSPLPSQSQYGFLSSTPLGTRVGRVCEPSTLERSYPWSRLPWDVPQTPAQLKFSNLICYSLISRNEQKKSD